MAHLPHPRYKGMDEFLWELSEQRYTDRMQHFLVKQDCVLEACPPHAYQFF